MRPRQEVTNRATSGRPVAPTPVQRVALRHAVDYRVQCLRALSEHVSTDSLLFAEALFHEHGADLWQRARTPDGQGYPSEEQFWEHALGLKRRTGFQLLARGKTLAALALPPSDRAALAAIGLYRFDVVAPVLLKEATVESTRRWVAAARTLSRDELRTQVNQTLGRPTRARSMSQRLQQYVVGAMPDVDSRALAEDFFTTGATYVGSDNAVAIVIAAMQEALGTWHAHAESRVVDIPGDMDAHDDTEGTPR